MKNGLTIIKFVNRDASSSSVKYDGHWTKGFGWRDKIKKKL